jgi:hypothetical protein
MDIKTIIFTDIKFLLFFKYSKNNKIIDIYVKTILVSSYKMLFNLIVSFTISCL